MHFSRKEFKLDEDPWDNYLFHDAKALIPLICHTKPLTISEQIILAKFIEYTIQSETISQYKLKGTEIIGHLIGFAEGFGNDSLSQVLPGSSSNQGNQDDLGVEDDDYILGSDDEE